MNEIIISPADSADFPQVLQLLKMNALPTDGVASFFGNFVVAKAGGRVVGAAGFELHGDHALLRSVVVGEDVRGTGLGERLVSRIIESAATKARSIYLLTTTAERYFPRFGFEITTRDCAPAALNASEEFAHACPATATLMFREL